MKDHGPHRFWWGLFRWRASEDPADEGGTSPMLEGIQGMDAKGCNVNSIL